MNKICRLWPIAALLLAGCAADEHDDEGRVPVNLAAYVDLGPTRGGTAVLATRFDEGEVLRAYFPENVSPQTTTYTVTDAEGSITPTAQPYLDGNVTTATVHAYYPQTVTHATESFSVAKDQTTDNLYKSGDLMYATAALTKTDGVAIGTLLFSHRMAKLIIDVRADETISAITGVRIVSGYRTIAVGTPLSCTLSAEAADLSDPITAAYTDDDDYECVKMYEDATGATHVQCAALLPPQTITAGDFIQIITNEGTATYSLSAAKTLVSGNTYTILLTLHHYKPNVVASVISAVEIFGWLHGGNAWEGELGTVVNGWLYSGNAWEGEMSAVEIYGWLFGGNVWEGEMNPVIYGWLHGSNAWEGDMGTVVNGWLDSDNTWEGEMSTVINGWLYGGTW